MKTYKAKLNDKVKGVYAISLVEDPAMEGHFVALKKQEVSFKTLNEEKRILIGLVLEPNKLIYRNQNNEEFNIVFDLETVKNLAHSFFKNSYQLNSTIEHEDKINGVSFVESWIIEDEENDKSNLYGFKYPKGSWLAIMKVDNDDVWNNYVKTNKVKGFSVDAMLDLEELNLKSNINMNNQIVDAIKEGFKAVFEKQEVKLGTIKTGDNTLTFEGDALEVGAPVWVLTENDEKIPAPVGEHLLENGQTLVIVEEGYVAEIREAVTEEPEAQQEMMDETKAQEIASAIKSVLIKYTKELDNKIEKINLKLENQLQENIELKAEVLKLSEQPAARKIVSIPQQVELTKEGRLLSKIRK